MKVNADPCLMPLPPGGAVQDNGMGANAFAGRISVFMGCGFGKSAHKLAEETSILIVFFVFGDKWSILVIYGGLRNEMC